MTDDITMNGKEMPFAEPPSVAAGRRSMEKALKDMPDELFEELPAPAKCAFPSGCGDKPWSGSKFCYVHTDKLDFAQMLANANEALRLERENVRVQADMIARLLERCEYGNETCEGYRKYIAKLESVRGWHNLLTVVLSGLILFALALTLAQVMVVQ